MNKPITITDDMVSRFLAWPLPKDFAPDCNVSFDENAASSRNGWPTGTNLFYAGQARAMLEHVLCAPDARPNRSNDTATTGEAVQNKQPSDQFEAEIVAKGLTAPRVTPADIEAAIAREHYFAANDGIRGATGMADDRAPERLLTFCVLVLRNGFTVTGESACASPENFDAELGRKIARENAVQNMWPLMGYALRERLSQGGAA